MKAIAVVGRAGIFPKSTSIEDFWQRLLRQEDLTSDATRRRWRVDPQGVLGRSKDGVRSIRGGYALEEMEHLSLDVLGLSVEEEKNLDVLHRWVLHTAAGALQDGARVRRERTGLILGNLSFPTDSMSAYAEASWFPNAPSMPKTHSSHRFMSGRPALFAKKILGLGGRAWSLDCACASGLVSIQMGCEALLSGEMDAVLTGAVNRADDLFIHMGFTALQALSSSGRSQPFSADADGLIPAEGAGFVLLKRLEDALRDGDPIFGIIRGVGVSNDGRGKGMLVPSSNGQIAAMQMAYRRAEIDAATVQFVECHATGTVLGDGTELRSMQKVFGASNPWISSLKGNMGHGITFAGIAGMIKLLESFASNLIPPHRAVVTPNSYLEETSFRLVQAPMEWDVSKPKRAALSAFGFGGNNAHIVVDAFEEPAFIPALSSPEPSRTEGIVIVALDAMLGQANSLGEMKQLLEMGDLTPLQAPMQSVEVDGAWVKFPPRDLEQALPQQTALLRLAQSCEQQSTWDPARTGIWVGMGTDVNICRYGARWRVDGWQSEGLTLPNSLSQVEDQMVAHLESAGVLGCMPNIPANRLNSQLDCLGASGSISAEEGSVYQALNVALNALERGEIDTAIVAGVDCANNGLHSRAKASETGNAINGLDAAAMFVLKRASDCTPEDKVYAEISVQASAESSLRNNWLDDCGDAHVAHMALGIALSAVSGRTEHIESVDLMGTGMKVLLSSQRQLLPQPVLQKRPMQLNYPPFVPPRLGQVDVRAPRREPLDVEIPLLSLEPKVPAMEHMATWTPSPEGREDETVQAESIGIDFQRDLLAGEHELADERACEMEGEVNPANLWWQEWQNLQSQHQNFLNQQSTLHHQYLSWNQQMMNLLFVQEHPPSQVFSNTRAVEEPQSSHVTTVSKGIDSTDATVSPSVHYNLYNLKKSTPMSEASVAESTQHPKTVDLLSHSVAEHAPIPTGLTLDKTQLKIHSSGAISEIYGSIFEPQDSYAIQTRMPEPPLLLADRVTGLAAVPGSMKLGTIWTETDVEPDSWFNHVGRMPAGIMIESGQADLMLISYLGIDLLTKGERAYRLLGCELMYHDDLPAIGDTLCYDIHVDGHAKHGDVRLFFFHYDCRINGQPRLTVRQGQAGFFTEAELADSDGILWTPESQEIVANPVLDPPTYPLSARTYSFAEVKAFSEGRPWECFGEGVLRTKTHTRTPTIQSGRMLFLRDEVYVDPKGGPWGRGYLKCTVSISPNDWYFEGHFKNDPCMPGTLMFEGCLQAMAFYLSAMGYTANRDGWRFQPVPKRPYPLLCRGQVLPSSKQLTYEIFVEECSNGEKPYVIADLLCTVDGLGAFHARGMGLELVPDHPLSTLRYEKPEILATLVDETTVAIATDRDGFSFNYEAMVASALGKPSAAFGAMYQIFDGHRRVARLPGAPYHFMSRVKDVQGELGTRQVGTTIVLDYDIPADAWYFDANGAKVMPFCVLLEAALQPCGWLASAVGSAVPEKEDLSFRNLDGTGTLHRDIAPLTPEELQTFETTVTITNISKSAGMIIEAFDVACRIDGELIYDLKTVFGFFPDAALKNQVGLPVSSDERATFSKESAFFLELTAQPPQFFSGSLCLPDPMLCMIDRLTGYEPQGGSHKMGWLRAEKTVDPAEWFFKAHFFQDPVQPGSLGIEAMIQVLQWYMIEQNLGAGYQKPRFTCLGLKQPMQWRYRGQVVPENKVITTTMDIVDVDRDEVGVFAKANASLWVDGKRIYEAIGMCMHIVESL